MATRLTIILNNMVSLASAHASLFQGSPGIVLQKLQETIMSNDNVNNVHTHCVVKTARLQLQHCVAETARLQLQLYYTANNESYDFYGWTSMAAAKYTRESVTGIYYSLFQKINKYNTDIYP